MTINLAQLPQQEMDKINVDLAAAGVAFKERHHIPVNVKAVIREQPAELHDWFHQRLAVHRTRSSQFSD